MPVQRWFYINTATRCGAIFEVFCARLGISLGAVKFLLRGERVFGASTPQSLTVSVREREVEGGPGPSCLGDWQGSGWHCLIRGYA